MDQVKKTITGFLLGILIYAIVIEVLGLLLFPKKLAFTLGLLLGVVVAIALMMHITYTLDRALDMPENRATKYVTKQAILRLAFMLVTMWVALYFDQIHFVATLLGLLGLKIGSFIAAPLLKKIYPDDFVTKLDEDDFVSDDLGDI